MKMASWRQRNGIEKQWHQWRKSASVAAPQRINGAESESQRK
jgi:hypothetical protein